MGSRAIIGSIQEFNPEKDRIKPYLERVALFLKANKFAADDQVPVFLTVIGGRSYSLLRDLLSPVKPEDATMETIIVETLSKHYDPKPLVTAERFHFHKRNQAPGESVTEYMAELRRLATHCNFGTNLDATLCDRLVGGLRSEAMQRKLLTEIDLTLQKALDLAIGMEAADQSAKGFKETEHSLKRITSATPKKSSTATRLPACHRCGRTNHTPDQCHFMDATCHRCGGRGHIAPFCRTPPQAGRNPPQRFRRHGRRGRMNPQRTGQVIADTASDESNPLPIHTLGGKHVKPKMVDLLINNKPVQMEIDTGAAVSLISEEVKRKLFPDIKLSKSRVLLQTYTGEQMTVLGEMRVHVKYGKQSKSLMLIVVAGDGQSLFGRDWLEQIRLNWKKIGAIAADLSEQLNVEQLCATYAEVFKGELGTITPFKAKLDVHPHARPKFCKARNVPYSSKEAVEQELDRLEAEGILEPVDHSEWATPIVVVPKKDGKYRICGDFSVTLNPVLDVDKYPLPKPQDLFATLSGGKTFTKLDLAQAYLQLLLEEESQQYVVVNTHKGLYKYKRLPFGVASSPALF